MRSRIRNVTRHLDGLGLIGDPDDDLMREVIARLCQDPRWAWKARELSLAMSKVEAEIRRERGEL